MTDKRVTIPELILIAGTRVALGASALASWSPAGSQIVNEK
jgi:hypothetical protein